MDTASPTPNTASLYGEGGVNLWVTDILLTPKGYGKVSLALFTSKKRRGRRCQGVGQRCQAKGSLTVPLKQVKRGIFFTVPKKNERGLLLIRAAPLLSLFTLFTIPLRDKQGYTALPYFFILFTKKKRPLFTPTSTLSSDTSPLRLCRPNPLPLPQRGWGEGVFFASLPLLTFTKKKRPYPFYS